MKHANVAIFIPHNGCPHQCSFCDQTKITGQNSQPTVSEVIEIIESAAKNLGHKTSSSEIAFFGGSFTAIDKSYMISLLDEAYRYVEDGIFSGIRISTRPDYINDEILQILKSRGVTAIELGAQSMDDDVLKLNNRGHTSSDVINAAKLIKQFGFSLGLQMMTGLYGSSYDKDYSTALSLAILKPDTIRIYPTVIMKNTKLCELYETGLYKPMSLDESIKLCSELLLLFDSFNIQVIRLGLHDSESLHDNFVAGCMHPAFRELCESKIFLDRCILTFQNMEEKDYTVYVNSKSVSKMIGQKKSNIKKLNEMGYIVKVKQDDSVESNNLRIEISR